MHILNESATAMWLDMHPFSPQMPPRNDAAYLRNTSRYTDSNEKLPSIVGQGLVSYYIYTLLPYTIMTTKGLS